VIDDSVSNTHSSLIPQIVKYFSNEKFAELMPEILVLAGGEPCKNDPRYYEEVIRAINEHGIDRHSFVACIGGGAFLDMVGYAAAISHRGIKLIRIPTTVLSQNDSGVGVKNSVNYLGKKNFLGTFAPPVAVFNDFQFLSTLDARDLRGGLAEAIKVALIKDIEFYQWIKEHAAELVEGKKDTMVEQIYRCAKLHMQHIASGDPFETGSARPLDFGHWAAHKLEYLSNFQIRHGEAVAIGICLDTLYSALLGYIHMEEAVNVVYLFQDLGFATYHEALEENDKINLFNGLNEFREHLGGQLTITLLEKIGKGFEVHSIDFDQMKKAVDILKDLSQ
jgi:3-dehydroquinate synthase